ncbi:MAG: ABC transporter ATP-binding protein [Bacteroidetes bacterium]|jgi:ABC-type multidrug transport system ATPase subunit|nr:ABC transporter ATP-binding protein [Bacteroidota bacterium]MBT5529678.1 ABC transporter ATP-binding protein [Cytophagia bacterium]MBT3423179.1 ABC transporter ATP-binding protein [Bacteroidota bacterium]MBT3802197.1 ABC transporter ATP-binding protein [Bacteroidota bacterium]MBT3935365.1 ABC transporter ATP-binding protein [Bacteroidota bacterium]
MNNPNLLAVQISNLSRSFGQVKALDMLSFQIEKGELFGFIGPDGAGKTTLFRIITSLLLPDEGSARVFDYDVVKDFKEIRKITGYMPGRFSLYHDLTVEENLNFYASIFGTSIEENYDLIKDIYSAIEPFKKRRAGKLSGGMKQKLALSCALIHKPEILILDEPTTGVDAVSRVEFWEMLRHLKTMGITILVSTPYMDEASLCDRVALMQKGQILSIDKPKAITGNFKKEIAAIRSNNVYQLIKDLRAYQKTESVYAFGQDVHFIEKGGMINKKELEEYLKQMNHKQIEIKNIAAGIEDCFMDLMKEE